MKKTIIALSIATITCGGIYLFNNKHDISPSYEVINNNGDKKEIVSIIDANEDNKINKEENKNAINENISKRIEKIEYDMIGFDKPDLKEYDNVEYEVYPEDFDPYFYIDNFYVNDDVIIPYELIEKDSLEYERIINEVQEKYARGQIKEIYNVQPVKMMNAKALYYFLKEGTRNLELINPYGEKIIVNTNNGIKKFNNHILRINMKDKAFVLRVYDDSYKIEYDDNKGYGDSESFEIKLDKNGFGYSFNTQLKNRKTQIKFID